MKKILLFILFLPLISSAQKIERDEIDKFLKIRFIETSLEPLKVQFVNALRFRCKNIDGEKYIETLLTFNSVCRVDNGDRMFFLFNDSISIPLECDRGEVARYHYSKYGSYWTLNARYKLTKEAEDAIKRYNLTAIRVGMAGEYYVFEDIKLKNSEKLKKALVLVSR